MATSKTKIGGKGCIGPNFWQATAGPLVDNDVSNGCQKGDHWLDTVNGSVFECLDNAAGAASWKVSSGTSQPVTTGVTERVIAKEILGGTSVRVVAMIEEAKVFVTAATANLTTQLPANCRVKFASLNLDTAVVLSTAVKLGLGVSGTPIKFALSSTVMTKNTKTDAQPLEANSLIAAAVTPVITATDTSGVAAGTVTSGTVRARIIYEYVTSIADAP